MTVTPAPWIRVKWTEAGQVAEMAGWRASPSAKADLTTPPAAFCASLLDEGLKADAARFLAHALPRHDAVRWAVDVVADLVPQDSFGADERAALKAASLWLQDPTDERRRAAFAAAEACLDSASPLALCAVAVFFSGGSIAPIDCEPIQPPREAAGRFVAAAVLAAAVRSGDMMSALDRAVDSAGRMAAAPP
jgi:hypothetical protein